MNGYACVYRHVLPDRRDVELTENVAVEDPFVRLYLDRFMEPGNLYDWGDDPAFFAATEIFGDPARASWGVCRPDIRGALSPGDFVAFFCVTASTEDPVLHEYFFVGVATVGQALSRHDLWSDDAHQAYRSFFNVLARSDHGELVQHEVIRPFHDDWRRRCASPYWLFDPERSALNFKTPLRVASYVRGRDDVERWRQDDERVEQLHDLLFLDPAVRRRLRTTNPSQPHRHLNLTKRYESRSSLAQVRSRLVDLAAAR